MESIEMITAQEKEVTIKDPKSGKNQIVIVKVRIVKAGTEKFLIQPRIEETNLLSRRKYFVKPICNMTYWLWQSCFHEMFRKKRDSKMGNIDFFFQ